GANDAGGQRGADDDLRFTEDAYVWQRKWTPAVNAAVEERGITFDVLHVLAAEIEPGGHVVRVPPPPALQGRAVIPVVRVDGYRIELATTIADEAWDVVGRFKAAGIDVKGVELDHDCAASKLSQYAGVIRAVKQAV